MPNCPRCGKQLSYIQQNGLWYCFACQQYFQPTVTTQPSRQYQQAGQQSGEEQPYPYYYQTTPPLQYVPPSDKSILPIIVAVVIIIIIAFAAAFFLFIIADEGRLESTGTTPIASMVWNEDYEHQGSYTGYVVAISGVASINTDDVTITVTHGDQSGSQDLDQFVGGPSLQIGDLTLEFHDQSPLGNLGPEDIFAITGGYSGDIIRLVYQPTGGLMCSTTLQ